MQMRIAVIHSFYRSSANSGENNAVLDQAQALVEMGHDVFVAARFTDQLLPLKGYSASAAVRLLTGRDSQTKKKVWQVRPDLIWIHNLFPNIGSSWLSKTDTPVVHSLHNFRPLCINGLLFRQGRTCTLCPEKSVLYGVRHRCYRGTVTSSLPPTVKALLDTSGQSLLARSNRLYALSTRSRDVYTKFGLEPSKIEILPNFVPHFKLERNRRPGTSWIAIGALTREKGFLDLLAKWPKDEQLDIFGEGESLPECMNRARGKHGIRFLGRLPRNQVQKVISGYSGLVFPSLLLENCPLTVLEALSVGVPVIARDGSAGADIVRTSGAGELYGDEDQSLRRCLNSVLENKSRMSELAFSSFLKDYSPKAWKERVARDFAKMFG